MTSKLILREANEKDSHFFWKLVNDPVVREVSFASEEILWEVHKEWFKKKLSEPSTLLIVAENDSKGKMGQLRFEKKNEEYVISVSLVSGFRGKGLGTALIKLGSEKLFETFSDAGKINAYIKHDNTSSIRSFEKAGYENAGFATVNEENDAIQMVKINTKYSTKS